MSRIAKALTKSCSPKAQSPLVNGPHRVDELLAVPADRRLVVLLNTAGDVDVPVIEYHD